MIENPSRSAISALDQVPTLQPRMGIRAAGAAKSALPRGAWEREDARQLGHLVDRTRRELSDEDIDRISDTCHAWRGEMDCGRYADVWAAVAEDETPFAERFAALQERLEGQFEEAERLTGVIRQQLAGIEVNG